MKQRVKHLVPVRILLFVLVCCMAVGLFFACEEKKQVQSISVVESTVADYYYTFDGFNIAAIKLTVTYADESTTEIAASSSMLTTEDKNALKTPGAKTITLYYQNQTAVVEFYLTSAEEELVRVTFIDVNGVKIDAKTTLKGGAVTAPEAPEVEGQRFKAWVEKDGTTEWDSSKFEAVEESITLTATYSADVNVYTVTFKDYEGNVLRSDKVEEGAYIETAPSYVKPAKVASYAWSVAFPYHVTHNATIEMQNVTFNYCAVQYGWYIEGQPNTVHYMTKYSESVVYGENASNYNKAKSSVVSESKGTILTEPTDNKTNIIKNTDFLFVVAAAKISVTVYNNEGMNIPKVEAKDYRIGEVFTFPVGTGESVSGKTFKGWRLYNPSKKTYSSIAGIYSSGSTWTVTDEYSSTVYVVPYYQAEACLVTFQFNFHIDDTNTFIYEKGVSDTYFPGDSEKGVIAYNDVKEMFKKLKNTNGGKEIENGSQTSIDVRKSLDDYEIVSCYINGASLTKYTVKTATLTVVINLKNISGGSTGLSYEKVLVLEKAPTVPLAPNNEITGWFYNDTEIPCFPYVYENNLAIDLSLLTYTTAETGSAKIDAPGYKKVTVTVGSLLPYEGYFVYDGEKYVSVAKNKPTFVSGCDYYTEENGKYKVATVTVGNRITTGTYYVWSDAQDAYVLAESVFAPNTDYYSYFETAGYVKTDVTVGDFATEGKYYTYDGAYVGVPNGTKFVSGKDYFTVRYTLNTDYSYGYEVVGTTSTFSATENVYIPDTYDDDKSDSQPALPVVAIKSNAFVKTLKSDAVSSEYEALYETYLASGTSYLRSIAKLSSGLIYVGDYGLAGMRILSDVTVEKIASIGKYAFAGANFAGNISFSSLQRIGGEGAFTKLNRFSGTDAVNLTFGGVLETLPQETFYKVQSDFTIAFTQAKVTSVGDRAFALSEKLTSAVGLENVKNLGDGAFKQTALTSVNFPDIEHIQYITDGAFAGMTSLTTLTLGTNGTLQDTTLDLAVIEGDKNLVTLVIGRQADVTQNASGNGEVKWDDKLQTISNNISDFASGAYQLKTVSLPVSAKSVSGLDKFVYLTEVIVSDTSDTFYTDDGVLYQISVKNNTFATGTTYYTYGKKAQDYVTASVTVGTVIPEGAYYVKKGETYVLAEESVTREYTYTLTFYPANKTGIYTMQTLPTRANTLVIDARAFGDTMVAGLDLRAISSDISLVVSMNGATPFIKGVMTNSVDKENVQSLYLLANVYIDNATYTSELSQENDWAEDKVYAIDEYKFYFSDSDKLLFELYEDVKQKVYRATVVSGYVYAEEVTVPKTVSAKGHTYEVTAIGEEAFAEFTYLKKLTIDANLIDLPYVGGKYYCYACNGTGKIDDVACYQCGGNPAKTYTHNAFGGVNDTVLEEITFASWHTEARFDDEEGNRVASVAIGSFTGTKWYEGVAIVSAGGHPFGFNEGSSVTEITAAMIKEAGFGDTIPAEFFKGTDITSIAFPTEITTVGMSAFEGCTALQEVDFMKVISINTKAFYGCTSLQKAEIPYLSSMGKQAFEGCSALEKFVADGLTEIPYGAFADDGELSEVSLKGAKQFGSDENNESYAFSGCGKLKEIPLVAYTATSIPGHAFYATGIKSVLLSGQSLGTVTEIGTAAFQECGNLEYVLLGSQVIKIEEFAFADCNDKMCVEIPYAQGGIYLAKTETTSYWQTGADDETQKVAKNAFDSGVTFYIDDSASANVNRSVLKGGIYQTTRPSISFEFYREDGDGYDSDFQNLELGIAEINNKIYFEKSDLVAPSFGNLVFVGWCRSDYTIINDDAYPLVLTENTTLKAKYYPLNKGTLATDDVEFIYLIDQSKIPDAGLDEDIQDPAIITVLKNFVENSKGGNIGDVTKAEMTSIATANGYASVDAMMKVVEEYWWDETATYKYYRKATQQDEECDLTSGCLITDVTASESFYLKVTVTGKRYQFKDEKLSVVDRTVKIITVDNPGTFGYAVINYSSLDASNFFLPDSYTENETSYPIIAVYAGAFRDSDLALTSLTLPTGVKVLLNGYYDTSSDTVKTGTFNSKLKTLTLPEGLTTIGNGVLTGLSGLENISFGASSNLLYTDLDTFMGTTWYKNAVLKGESGNGFVSAGRVAIEYVGQTDSIFVDDLDANQMYYSEVTSFYGVQPLVNGVVNTETQSVTVRAYYADGIVSEFTYSGAGNLDGGEDVSGNWMYKITLKKVGDEDDQIIIYINKDKNGYKSGSVTVEFKETTTGIESYRFVTSKETTVILPAGTVKVVDGIMKDNTDVVSLTIDTDLVYIGEDAFNGCSALTTVGYDVDKGYLTTIGKNAFVGTQWYYEEKVIIGGIFLKYNNRGGGTSVTIPGSVTRIAEGAFAKATFLEQVLFEGNKVTVIEDKAFAGSHLNSITLPSSVTSIGRGIFKNCTYLSDANLSQVKVTELPIDTFYGCVALEVVEISATVTKFGENAFFHDGKLSSVTATGIVEIEEDVFEVSMADGREYSSNIDDTKWYNAESEDEDRFLILGSVLVRYVMGKDTVAKASEKDENGQPNVITVTVPTGVKTILKDAFSYNQAISNEKINVLVIPSTVETIGENAFYKCAGLTEVQFGSGSKLTEIGANAFADCRNLKTVVLPEGLVKIGDAAFNNTAITTEIKDEKGIVTEDNGFVIPDTVTEIGQNAFKGVKTLTVLKLGAKLEKIGEGAFDTNYTPTGSASTEYGSLYKILWTMDTNKPVDEKGVTGDSVFEKLTDYIKGSDLQLTKIFKTDDSAINLRIYFAKSVLEDIQQDTDHADIWPSAGVEYISFVENGVYPTVTLQDMNGSALDEITDTEYIQEGDLVAPVKEGYTFVEWKVENSENGTAVTYPLKVRKAISLYAYYMSNNPESISSDVYTFADGKITSASCSTLYVPETIGTGSKAVEVSSFELNGENSTVTKIVLMKSKAWGWQENPFKNFKNLVSVELPNGTSDTDFVVEKVTLKATVGTGLTAKEKSFDFQAIYSIDGKKLFAFIGEKPVDDEGNLVALTYNINAGVETICSNAFCNAYLSTVYIPNSVVTIGSNVFNGYMKKLRLQANGLTIQDASRDMFSAKGTGSFWETEAQSTNNGTYIEVSGAKYKNATEGESGYFYALGNILLGYKKEGQSNEINKLTFPVKASDINITVIAKEIFSDEDLVIKELTLPLNVQKINTDAFVNDCDILNVAEDTNGTKYPYLTDIADTVFHDNLTYYNSGTVIILGHVYIRYAGTDTSVTIPNTIVNILASAFANSSYLQNIQFASGSTLKRIGPSAFYGDTKLKAISIPDTVTYIGANAFQGCTYLSNVEFNTQTSKLIFIGDRAFMNCTSLTDLKLPCSLQNIGKEAFSNCTALQTVTFVGYKWEDEILVVDDSTTSALTEIGAQAFSGCESLTTFDMPNGVTEIKQATFLNCRSLVTVKFDISNSKLVSIGAQAFMGCEKLGSKIVITNEEGTVYTEQELIYNDVLLTLHLPNRLQTVDNEAFSGCTGLWGVQFNRNVVKLGSKIFTGCDNLVKVFFNCATAPQIETDTFANDKYTNSKYRLRIYVQQSEPSGESDTYGPIMAAYIAKWTGIEINGRNIKYYIYEKNMLPTLSYTTDIVNGTPNTKTVQAEIVIEPKYDGKATNQWIYTGATQNVEKWIYSKDGSETDYKTNNQVDSDENRKSGDESSKYVYVNSYNRQSDATGDNNYRYNNDNYVIIIVDYDEVSISIVGLQ